jgi:hypothetical protein
MATSSTRRSGDEVIEPGTVRVSAAALQLAHGFEETIRRTQLGDWVVVFDWAESIGIRRGPNEPLEDIGACMVLGAFERGEIPPGYTQRIDGLEFAIQIPKDVLVRSEHCLIDVDETLLFKLALR